MSDIKSLPALPGGYKYIKKIGTGGQGAVWLVLNENMGTPGRQEAAKVLFKMNDQERDRFTKEINSLASLNHPNIVTIYYASPEENYFIMENLPKGSFESLIGTPSFSILEGVKVLKQVADGLAFAHAKGLIHRDLKPQNILFSSEMIPKITDFGLVKSSSMDEASSTNVILGTPKYMAPEQWKDASTVDHRSDIWAFGIMMYIMLAKRFPYDTNNNSSTMYQCLTKAILPPHTFNPDFGDVESAIEPICLKCLAKEKEERYQKADEIVEALENIILVYRYLEKIGSSTGSSVHVEMLKSEVSKMIPTAPEKKIVFGEQLSLDDEEEKQEESPEEEEKENGPQELSFADEVKPQSKASGSKTRQPVREPAPVPPQKIEKRNTPLGQPASAPVPPQKIAKRNTPSGLQPPKKIVKSDVRKKSPATASQPKSMEATDAPRSKPGKSGTNFKKIALALSAVAIVLAGLYFFFKPPSLKKLRHDLEFGTPSQKIYALDALESQSHDPAALHLLFFALNDKSHQIRGKSSMILSALGSLIVPELMEVALDPSKEYQPEARSEALRLLGKLNAIQMESKIHELCDSSQTDETVRQSAIDTLLILFPKYQKEYQLIDGKWAGKRELENRGYIQIDGKWQSLLKYMHRIKENVGELEKEKEKLMRSFSEYSKNVPLVATAREAKAMFNPHLEHILKYKQVLADLELPVQHRETNQEIAQGVSNIQDTLSGWILEFARNWSLVADNVQKKGNPAHAFVIHSNLIKLSEETSAWKWVAPGSSLEEFADLVKKIQAGFQERRKEIAIPVLLEIENETGQDSFPEAMKEAVHAALWNSQKIPLFFSGETKEHPLFVKFAYSEGKRESPKKWDSFSARCRISYWEKERSEEPIWQRMLFTDQAGTEKNDEKRWGEQIRTDLLQKLKAFHIPFAEIEQIGTESESQEKEEGSTFYRQTAEDVIHLKDGRVLKGLIEEETDGHLSVIHSWMTSGKKMSAIQKIEREKVAKVEKIPDDIRKFRLELIKSEKMNLTRQKKGISAIQLEPIDWEMGTKGKGWQYQDERFLMLSNAPPTLVKEFAYRVSEIFKGYERFFKVERNSDKKIKIFLFGSVNEYRSITGGKILNPAFYWPAKNYIVAATDIKSYQKAVEDIRRFHGDIRKKIEDESRKVEGMKQKIVLEKRNRHERLDKDIREGKMSRAQYDNEYQRIRAWETAQYKVLNRYNKGLQELKEKLYFYDYRLKKVVDEVAEDTLKALYHEAFHAFLQNFLFSPEQVKSVPLWLNEGLAQFFENSFMQGDVLLIGQMDPKRVSLLKKYIQEEKTVPLSKFLEAGSPEFLVKSMKDVENSNIHYLQAWGIVFYLATHYDLSRGNFFADYVTGLWRGQSPVAAFEKLTQKNIEEFDGLWKKAVRH